MADIYITREELKNAPYNIVKEDDKYIEVLQDLTKDFVDNLCGQDFSQEGSASAYTEKKISGTGKDTIFLPKRLITLEKIRIYSNTLSYVDYTDENFTIKAKFISWNVFSSGVDNPRFYPEDFPAGTYNIGVFGIWGWALSPNPVKYLQGRLIQKIIDNGSLAEKLKSEKVGDYTYQLNVISEQVTGDFELDQIIKQYQTWVGYAVT